MRTMIRKGATGRAPHAGTHPGPAVLRRHAAAKQQGPSGPHTGPAGRRAGAARSRGIIADRITSRGRRLTRQRMVVAEALAGSAGRAVSAQELHERLRPRHPHLGLATVYRALEAQVLDGMAARVERSGHVSAYVACDASHHHHLVCERCQRVERVAPDAIEPTIAAVRRRHGFEVDHAALDLYGLCARCRRRVRA